jgi:hypothetical protein
MTARSLLRTLTPWGWLAAALALAAILIVAGRGLGLRWDPFGIEARRLEATQRRVVQAETDLRARRLEVEAAAEQARRIDDHHQQAVAVARATATRQAQARSAHDALTPLDTERVARLRAHDGELCRFAPDLCSAAPVGAADDSHDALPPGSAAAGSDAG